MASSPRLLQVGEPAPWFTARCTANPRYAFDTAAGRYVVLCFFGSAAADHAARVLGAFRISLGVFDDQNAAFFGVSTDPADETARRVEQALPGYRYFWDFDGRVSTAYGAATEDGYRPHTLVLDPRLRVVGRFMFDGTPADHVARVLRTLAAQPIIGSAVPAALQAPVLVVPRVFEPELCRALIRYYDDRGGEDSGFMRDVGGQTVGIIDYAHKRRRDREIEDPDLRTGCMYRIRDRLIPEVHKAFQFKVTRMERYIVACYDAADGGHFRAHRDNTTRGTAHRRFAVSLILNTGEFEGGYVRFPEYGPHLYTAPVGGSVVFSCSLLHEATPVTHGKRYVFLPFLYDDAAAKVRQENVKYLAADVDPPLGGAPPVG